MISKREGTVALTNFKNKGNLKYSSCIYGLLLIHIRRMTGSPRIWQILGATKPRLLKRTW